MEIQDVNTTLRVVIAPIVLGGTAIAARYLMPAGDVAGAPVATAASRVLGKAAHGMHAGLMSAVAASAIVVGLVGVTGDRNQRPDADVGPAFAIAAPAGTSSQPVAPAPPRSVSGSPMPGTPPRAPGSGVPKHPVPPSISSTQAPVRPPASRGSKPSSQPPASPARPVASPSAAPSKSEHTPSSAPTPKRPSGTPTPAPIRGSVLVTVHSAAGAGVARLTARVPRGWTIRSVAGPSGYGCHLHASRVNCSMRNPGAGSHRFTMLIDPPATAGPAAVLHVRYAERNGSSLQDIVL
jgi:hypothetical protein